MNVEDFIKALLVEGEDDWVMSWTLYWADDTDASPSERVDTAIDLVEQVVRRGWMVIGELGDDGFVAWTTPLDESLRRARTGLERYGDEVKAGIAFWLCNTELGDQVARELVANGYELPE